MFKDSTLQEHLETSSVIRTQSAVIAEWNMNIAENIKQVGNYRYRNSDAALPRIVTNETERDEIFEFPVEGNKVYILTPAGLLYTQNYTSGEWITDSSSIGSPEELKYNYISSSFATEDETENTSKFYYGATDADTVIDGGYEYTTIIDSQTQQSSMGSVPVLFQSKKEKEKMLYSLEDCLGRFRPRSGINKLRYFAGHYTHHSNQELASRPRYYMADKKDPFKYWTSYRTENGIERGLSKLDINKLLIVGAIGDGDTVTYAISNPHNIQIGQTVKIDGINPVSYNNQSGATVTAVTANTISISSTVTDTYITGGVIDLTISGKYRIDDAAPFAVYNSEVPANRLIVKMQTNIGTYDFGTFENADGSFSDPFYGDTNKTTPVIWKVQYLENNNWVDAISFDANSIRKDGSQVIGADGYVEIAYGLIIPDKYVDFFYYSGEYPDQAFLPEASSVSYGSAYHVKTSETDAGTYYVKTETDYESFPAVYSWKLEESNVNRLTNYVTDLTSPSKFYDTVTGLYRYREFQYISGMRVVVETMNTVNSTFDLIEMSPRLSVDLTDKVRSFSITKNASDLGVSGMPVGQLLASTGNLSLFDYDLAFTPENVNSIVSNYTTQNTQIKFYEIVAGVENTTGTSNITNLTDYYVPLKTMYSEGFPEISNAERSVSLSLRDAFFYFESLTAPQILIQNASLSYAVALLLDGIGFSNYSVYRIAGESEVTIPYFYVGPDMSVAQILSDIAVSTQSAMFFDEYNNFIVMSKNYMMPSASEREIDMTLYGSTDFSDIGVVENQYSNSRVVEATGLPKLANIIEIASQNNEVYNDGIINYSTKYIQRSYSSIRQASMIDRDKTWIYKPSLLWEVSADDSSKSQNDEVSKQSSYSLAAIPLNSDLTDVLPTVLNHQVINNTIDLGDGIYWLSRYNGYLYANGEIIRYDAVQYAVGGVSNVSIDPLTGEQLTTLDNVNVVWISNVQEYQKYFAQMPFNGKLYPTGLVRIYSEPNYEIVEGSTRLKDGEVAKHGRTQFGTGIKTASGDSQPVFHNAGLSIDWSGEDYLRGCYMDERYLFSNPASVPNVSVINGPSGVDTLYRSRTTTREGVIKNFLTNTFQEETTVSRQLSTQTATVQSSALVMTGSTTASEDTAPNFLTYIYKPLSDKFVHFGTRMRIIGKVENNETRGQTPINASTYYTSSSSASNQSASIGGASGGLAFMLNPETNTGYYFEIVALTENSVNDYVDSENIHNILFYKIQRNAAATLDSDKAIPVKLWGGTGNILVDNGQFTGQYRMMAEPNPTVYDLSVEYQKVGQKLRFHLYINNVLVQTVDDPDPLEIHNNMAPFIRGASRVMFENIYALTNNYSQNTTYSLGTLHDSVFGDEEISTSKSLQKYAMSGIIQSTYLSGISSQEPPKYKLYFEEFGTIMREAAYFNVRYDKAYPAISAKLAPTFNKLKGYTVSGFNAGAYSAEFMIFNATDSTLSLDSTSGNYLRILGVTFTQQSNHQLTVDEYFSKASDLSNPEFTGSDTVKSILKTKQDYQDIKFSRLTHGKKQFSITTPYVQTQDDANDLMGWLSSKIMQPRKSVGVKLFGTPTLQLGDIVNIDYKNNKDLQEFNEVSLEGSRFVVYSIQYSKDTSGPTMTVYLSEVK